MSAKQEQRLLVSKLAEFLPIIKKKKKQLLLSVD
jgi:hypothetical protein